MSFPGFITADGVKARIAVLLIAALVDLLLGDPHWLWHPVQGIGALISMFENIFRRLFGVPWAGDHEKEKPQESGSVKVSGSGKESGSVKMSGNGKESGSIKVSGNGKESGSGKMPGNVRKTGIEKEESRRLRERLAGVCMVIAVLALSIGITLLLLQVCGRIHPWLRIAAEGILCGRFLALRSLGEAGRSVRDPLRAGDLEGARKAVSMIVGRDTERLDAQGIGKAAVETVAENTSDGVTAPLFYMVLFGGPGGVFYKAVNTMDSMTGYKNNRYRYFGTAAARLDDILNFIPSRLTALFMILACHLPVPAADRSAGRAPDGKSAFRVWRRDRRKSPSPNSAQTESVCAGALHIRLLGDTWYFGELHHKQEIGDGLRPVETEDITRAVRLMNGTSGLMYAVSICILLLILMLTTTGCAGAGSSGSAGKQTENVSGSTDVIRSDTADEVAGSEKTEGSPVNLQNDKDNSLQDNPQTEQSSSQIEQSSSQTEQNNLQTEQGSEKEAESEIPAPGTYVPTAFTVHGGTGKVTITCPEVTIPAAGDPAGNGETAEALLVFSSPHYEWVKAGGIQYDPVNAEDSERKTSEFRIPAVLEEEMEIIGLTTAMSEPHEITYTIRISLTDTGAESGTEMAKETGTEAGNESGNESGTEEGKEAGTELENEAGTADPETKNPGEAASLAGGESEEDLLENPSAALSAQTDSAGITPPELPGLRYVSAMERAYAQAFDIFFYVKNGETDQSEKKQFSLIDVHGSARYLLVPEGEETPADISREIVVLHAPLEHIYVAATSSMALFDAAGALDQVKLTGTDVKGWYIDSPKKALQEGSMIYAGKYSSPDYELLAVSGCDLAVESTMILHAPEVKEKLEELGIPVLIDTSSSESHPLGRTEWVRLYGVLTGHRAEADAFFAKQAEKLSEADAYADTGKTVAFFSITSTGNVIVRASKDYIPRMISLAGGRYIFSDLENTSGSSASVRLSMETFYSEAKDADYLIYNATIESPLRSLAELTGKSGLFSDFKAVQEGNVWQIRRSLYQSPDIAAEMITDIHGMLTGGAQKDMIFLEKVE